MIAKLAASVWPAKYESVEYVRAGDIFRFLIRRTDGARATCLSCRTVNQKGTLRCCACGALRPTSKGKEMPPRGGIRKTPFSDAHAWRNVLILALTPTVLLCLAFLAWYAVNAGRDPLVFDGEVPFLNLAVVRALAR